LRPERWHGPAADLLRQRVIAHDLDPDWVLLSDPALFAKLTAICSTCKKHKRCAADLADESFDPARPGWRDYCLNASMLNLYSAVVNYFWRADPAKRRAPANIHHAANKAQ
jgi:hypothetical protein